MKTPKIGDIIQFTTETYVWSGEAEAEDRYGIKVTDQDVCLVVGIKLPSNGRRNPWPGWVEMLHNGQIIHAASSIYGKVFHTIIPANPPATTI